MRPFARRKFHGIEVASLDCAGSAFAPHFHDEFVLSVNVCGSERIRLDRKALEAGEREITLYNPAQVQSSHAVSREWRFLSLYVDPSVLNESFDLPLETVFEHPVLKHEGAAARMADAILYGLDPDVLANEAIERLIQTLDELLTLAGSQRAPNQRRIPDALFRVAERLSDGGAPPSLQELSEDTGLTPVQLVRAFTRAYGLPPFTWASNQRVNEARVRMLRGEAIAQIAADLGFADQAHLTRRFRATYGVPPGRWRNS
ncbi:hypothetical protein ASG54_03385 [Aureimonas sp. Leaf460]|nr:hypothetical protein ASG62_21420 [Aureimonas sp. Leaf427]KQT78074.1 hypothetical protein ASG54_03385 [Aureimonas sp. Leaf460]